MPVTAPGTVSTNCVIRPNWIVTMTVPVHVHVRHGRQVMAAMTEDMCAVMCWNIVEHVRMLSNTCNLKKKRPHIMITFTAQIKYVVVTWVSE